MSNTTSNCCPDCGRDQTVLKQQIIEERRRADEKQAALEAMHAEVRVTLEQLMAEGMDIAPLLDALEREGVNVGQVLFP